MVKEALLDSSSGKFITLSLDGETVKGAMRIDKISNNSEFYPDGFAKRNPDNSIGKRN